MPGCRGQSASNHATDSRQVWSRDLIRAATQQSKSFLRVSVPLWDQVIGINSASYHAWSFRWECLLSTCSKRELKDERAFLERVAAVNVKNYQLWNYRRRLAIKLGPNSAEEVRATRPPPCRCCCSPPMIVAPLLPLLFCRFTPVGLRSFLEGQLS